MKYRETSIEINIHTRALDPRVEALFENLKVIEREFARRGEGYIKVEIFNNEIEEEEKSE